MNRLARGAFVGSSAAAFVAANAASGDAQGATLGGPHPPLVAEDDPAITATHLQLQRPDATISAYAAFPKTVTATTPGIVMTAHIWGVDSQYRDLARRFAKIGYIAIAPGIFDRAHPPNGDGATDIAAFGPAVAQMYAANTMNGDLLAARTWVLGRAPRAKIGLYGNCMGGGIALQAMVGNTDYAAAAILYGYVRADRKQTQPPPPGAFDWATHVAAAVIGFYGGADRGIDPADVQAAYAKLAGPHDVTIFPDAPHAFFDDERASYRAGPAAETWAKMTAWYGKYLQTP